MPHSLMNLFAHSVKVIKRTRSDDRYIVIIETSHPLDHEI